MFKIYKVNGEEWEVSNEREAKFLQEFPDAELIEDTVSTPTETVTQEEIVSPPQKPSLQELSFNYTPEQDLSLIHI